MNAPLARISAVVFVAIAVTATTIEMSRTDDVPISAPSRSVVPNVTDPLRPELARCARLGEASARDPSCLHAWAANRQRFLGAHSIKEH